MTGAANSATDSVDAVYYVGIGASAGGLEALETFFAHMPPDSGMAFIVIQHLSPDYKSLMVELLSKRTEMPVRRAEEGMPVERNTVYLIPPKKNLSIFHGRLVLTDPDHSRGVNLPIDLFLRSLADDQAEKAIAVILSGTGSDGVRGVRAIKEAGGIVLVQSEESAKFDGMPRAAISTGVADLVLAPEDMPARLLAFTDRPPLPVGAPREAPLLSDEDGLTRIFALLRERTRVDFTFYKPSTLIRRIERRMTVNQLHDLREYVSLMENHAGEVNALYRELLIGVTSFFRDREVFEELASTHLPSLLTQAARRELRFWVAGCSTGEEAYTLAILAREAMERLESRVDVKIFATDLDRDAIIQAGTGLYPESITADLSPRLLTKYFHRKEDHYQVDRSIREMVVFAQHNLVRDPPFTNLDLASCRNLLIYFQPVLQHKVLDLMNFSLKPGGLLLLGTSETVGDMADYYEPVHQRYRIYRSKGKRRPAPDISEVRPNEASHARPRTRFASGAQLLRSQDDERVLDRFLQAVANDYVPLALIVDEQLQVLHIIGNPEGYFQLTPGRMVNDIARMASRDLAIPLTTGLQRVFKTGEEVKYTNIRLRRNDESELVQLRIRQLPGRKGQDPLCSVFVERPAPSVVGGEPLPEVFDVGRETEQRIQDLEQELQFTRENLQATIEELETANEELQATNEELLASNEELQSTNEELQSVNEELHTVNAEYQRKIFELTQLNNDLDNLFANTRLAILILDENLEIRRFTPEVTRIFTILESDIGRPISHLAHSLVEVDPVTIAHEVMTGETSVEREVRTRDGGWFLMRVLPYRVGRGTVAGAVMTLVDIALLRRTQAALSDSESRMASLYRAMPVGIGLVVDRIVTDASPRVLEMLGYQAPDLIGRNTRMLYANDAEYERVGQESRDQIGHLGVCTVETAWRRKDDTFVPIQLTMAPLDPAQPAEGLTFTVLDLSIRYRAQARADASEERYRTLFNTMAEGIVYHLATGEIESANPAAERILGLTLDQMRGVTSMDPRWRAMHEDGSPFPGEEHPAMVALRTGRSVHNVIMGIFNPAVEDIRWINVNAVPLFAIDGTKPSRVYATFTDITDRVNSVRDLARAEERLDAALDVAGFAWWEWTVPTGRVEAHPLKARLLGFEPREVEADVGFWRNRIHPEDREAADQAMRDHLNGHASGYEAVYRIRTKAGTYRRFQDRGRVVARDGFGRPVRLVGTVHLLEDQA